MGGWPGSGGHPPLVVTAAPRASPPSAHVCSGWWAGRGVDGILEGGERGGDTVHQEVEDKANMSEFPRILACPSACFIYPCDASPAAESVHVTPSLGPPALMLLGAWKWQGHIRQT